MLEETVRNSSADRRRANRSTQRQCRVRARAVFPGRRLKITRRCFERRFFLTPDNPKVRQIIGYLLGYCLDRYGLKLHAACFMGNHYHLDVTDVHGNYPEFKAVFNGLLARVLNAHRGRFDRFWSADRPCDVELLDDNDVLRRMAYTIANPVSAGLVPRSQRWPGFTSAGVAFGSTMSFERPSGFFDSPDSDMPKTVEVRIERPPIMKHLSDEELMTELDREVREREFEAAQKLRQEGRRFALETRIARQKWHRRPRTFEQRFTTTPSVAASCKWSRIAALQRNCDWEQAYADAREADVPGTSPVYPYGTYARRRYGGARVAAAPS